jgi:hypothetical protein
VFCALQACKLYHTACCASTCKFGNCATHLSGFLVPSANNSTKRISFLRSYWFLSQSSDISLVVEFECSLLSSQVHVCWEPVLNVGSILMFCHLRLGLPSGLFFCVHFPSLSYVPRAGTYHHPWFDHPNDIWWAVHVITQFPAFCRSQCRKGNKLCVVVLSHCGMAGSECALKNPFILFMQDVLSQK